MKTRFTAKVAVITLFSLLLQSVLSVNAKELLLDSGDRIVTADIIRAGAADALFEEKDVIYSENEEILYEENYINEIKEITPEENTNTFEINNPLQENDFLDEGIDEIGEENAIPVDSVTVIPSYKELELDEKFTLSVSIIPENADDKAVRWESSDKDIAEVDYYGNVTGRNVGRASIYAITSNGKSAKCDINVKPNMESISDPEIIMLSQSTEKVNAPDDVLISVLASSYVQRIELEYISDDGSQNYICNLEYSQIDANKNYQMIGMLSFGKYSRPGRYRINRMSIALYNGRVINYLSDIKEENISEWMRRLPNWIHEKNIEVVNNGQYDIEPPDFIDISISETQVVIPANIGVTLIASDDVSGITGGYVEFENDAGRYNAGVDLEVVGKDEEGNYILKGMLYLDMSMGSGPYIVSYIELIDVADNEVCYDKYVTTAEVSQSERKLPQKARSIRLFANKEETEGVFKLIPTNRIIGIGDSFTISSNITALGGSDRIKKWESSNDAIAKVDDNGIVTGISKGSAEITATTAWGRDGMCQVVVSENVIPVTGIKISSSNYILEVGDFVTLSACIIPDNATNNNIKWKSENSNIAIISNTGIVKGIGIGKTIITAYTDDGFETVCSVEVKDKTTTVVKPELKSVKIRSSMQVGIAKVPDEVTFVISTLAYVKKAEIELVSDFDLNKLRCTLTNVGVAADGYDRLAGTISLDENTFPGCYRINKVELYYDIGKVIQYFSDIKKEEITETKKKLPDGIYDNTLYIENTQKVVSVNSISLSPKTKEIRINDSFKIEADIEPTDASIKTVSWFSENPDIAAVTDEGVVTGLKEGNAIIIATAHNGKKSKCAVEVWQDIPLENKTTGSVNSVNVEKAKTTINYSISKPGVIKVIIQDEIIKRYEVNAGENAVIEIPGIKTLIDQNINLVKGRYLNDFDIELYDDSDVSDKLLDGYYNIPLDRPYYRLEVESSDTSMGIAYINDEGTTLLYPDALDFKIYAKANPGYKFDHWQGDDPAEVYYSNPLVPTENNLGKYIAYFKSIKGDVTGDGEVTMADVVRVARAVAGSVTLTDKEKAAADVTGDGDVAIGDVVRIARFVAGSITEL